MAARLSAEVILTIRQRWRDRDQVPVTQAEMARDYGVSVVYIGQICRGEVRHHLKMPAREMTRDELQQSAERLMAVQREVEASGLSRLQQEAAKTGDAMLAEIGQAGEASRPNSGVSTMSETAKEKMKHFLGEEK